MRMGIYNFIFVAIKTRAGNTVCEKTTLRVVRNLHFVHTDLGGLNGLS